MVRPGVFLTRMLSLLCLLLDASTHKIPGWTTKVRAAADSEGNSVELNFPRETKWGKQAIPPLMVRAVKPVKLRVLKTLFPVG